MSRIEPVGAAVAGDGEALISRGRAPRSERTAGIEPVPVATADDVDELVAVARAEGRLALDTEFHWERTYAPILCLLQAATRDRLCVIDPLEGGDVGPIVEVVADPAVELVVHAPSADLLLMALRFDALAASVFDTQVVAGFVGLGVSMAYDRLVEGALGVRLQHDETFSDWRRRPLSATQLAYAADDVRYLLPLADELRGRLVRLGREQWAEDELQRRYGDPETIVPEPELRYQRVQRRGRLGGRQLAILREVAAWRERQARRRDLPRDWVIRDASLVELAKIGPTDAGALHRVRGIGNLGKAETASLLEAIVRGKEASPIELGREPAPEVARRAAVGSALAAVLVKARCDAARIAPELVATRADQEEFARRVAQGSLGEHPLATGWRRELVGAELEQLLSGKLALVANDRPPYMSVVPAPAT